MKMTKEEAIETLTSKDVHNSDKMLEALDMAIKSLEQEPILDKIRAEIVGLTYYWCEVNPKTVIDDVLQIINKYKAESEDKE